MGVIEKKHAHEPIISLAENYIIILMSFILFINASLTIVLWTSLSFFLTVPNIVYGADQYRVEINKTRRILTVSNNTNRIVKQFDVALGRGGSGHKKSQGDGVTPIGSYTVVGFNKESDFHYFIRLNYPNNDDALAAYRQQSITFNQFQEILNANTSQEVPPQNTYLGGAIGLHGIGNETEEKLLMHSKLDWTQGCIALKNSEIEQLKPFLTLGVHVVIKE